MLSKDNANVIMSSVQSRMVLVVNFFEIEYFCFVVAIFDLVHDVEAIHDLC